MDSLDGNLHSSLLAALAANLSSSPSSSQHDLARLTAPLQDLEPSQGINGNGGNYGVAEEVSELLAQEQVESIVAFAAYAASATVDAQEAAAVQVLRLLSQLPSWEVELAVGTQTGHAHPPSSRLAHALVSASLRLASTLPSSRTNLLITLSRAHSSLESQLLTSRPERVISFLLPALEGLARAYSESTFVYSAEDAAPTFESAEKLKEKAADAFVLPWTPDTEEGRAVLAMFDIYRSAASTSSAITSEDEQGSGVSPSTPLLARLAMLEAYYSSFLFSSSTSTASSTASRWSEALRVSSSSAGAHASVPGGREAAEEAMRIWEDTVEKVERVTRQEESEDELEVREALEVDGAGEVLVRSLRLAALASFCSPAPPAVLLPILTSLLAPTSVCVSPSLQILSLQSLSLLYSSHPSTAQTLKLFVLSSALHPSDDFSAQNLATDAAVAAWERVIRSSGDGTAQSQSRTAAVQSLLNFVAKAERDGYYSDGEGEGTGENENGEASAGVAKEREVAAANAVEVVAGIGRGSGEVGLLRFLLSTLSSHLLSTPSPLVLTSLLSALVSLAPSCPDTLTYLSLLRTITSCASAPSSLPLEAGGDEADDAEKRYQACLTALSRLAEIAARKNGGQGKLGEEGEGFLTEVLALFNRQAAALRGKKVRPSQRSETLLALVPVLSTFLTLSSFSPSSHISSSLSALFRSFWYTCLLNGFLSSNGGTYATGGGWAKLSEWQQEALRSVAERSPSLVSGVGDELVEMFAALEGILKAGEHPMSIDALRTDLSTSVPSQSSAARSLSSSHAVFLTTILRLESLRASGGSISPFFSYLSVPVLTNSPTTTSTSREPALADALKSVGDKVLSTYSHHLSEQVTSHALDPRAYSEVREVLLACVNQRSQGGRETALRWLDNVLSSFPSLVCDLEVVTVMLELLTTVRTACLAEFTDEYTPTYTFHSTRGNFTLSLTDDYPTRNRILRSLHSSIRAWLIAGITRSPLEMQGLLQEYIDVAGDGYRGGMQATGEEEMGKSVALELVTTSPGNGKYAALPAWGNWHADASSSFARTFAAKSFFGGEAQRSAGSPTEILSKLEELALSIDKHKLPYKLPELRDLFYRGAATVIKSAEPDFAILHLVVTLPIRLFTEASIAVGQEVWTWLADARPELEPRVVAEVLEAWAGTVEKEQGLFSQALDPENPLDQKTEYTPTDKADLTRDYLLATRVFSPMVELLDFLSSRFQAFRYRNSELVEASMRLVVRCLAASREWSTHPLARELRFRFLSFGFCLLQGSRLESVVEYEFRTKLYDAVLQWFEVTPRWSYGSNRIQLKSDLQAIDELYSVIAADVPDYNHIASASDDRASSLPGRIPISAAREHHRLRQQLSKVLLDDEADRVRLWLNPLQDAKRGPLMSINIAPVEDLRKLARFAWSRWPKVVVFLPHRFKEPALHQEVCRLVRADPERAQDSPDALAYFVEDSITPESRAKLRHLLFWAPVPVPSALRFLQPKFGNDPILLQYALRVLEHHPVDVTFFYVPQVVQALRTDVTGYAERFIFETSKISQLFCHQIIWNMKANAFRGDNAEEPDPMKPTLDRMVDMIVESLSGDAKDFYQREFTFFDEVTSISGKLKPFIKASKPEKKAKIDEEMAKIKVDPGVYLPSNPDGVLVDINRTSGRPLQSHAKAPFMATFKVRRTRPKTQQDDLAAQDALIDVNGEDESEIEEYDTWQSAIFKVGDDCRQDVLALQIIAIHKNIFNTLGLDLLVTPYRVTATGPGCGVIDVIPNATSRDEMGRAKINDLQSFFIMKYGPIDSTAFQRARINFIQSMAAYSLLCYIVQIKDRHNGNIMVDGRGCITHIDFGFLFDIGPGGVKFEPNSFKLSHEMVVLMGGRDSIGFRQFRELTVKAFLSARYYAQAIVDTTNLMLSAEFPSFKGEGTIERLKGRFRLDLSEKEAAKFMVAVIDDACENKRSIVYDEFQRVTNGIPYTR